MELMRFLGIFLLVLGVLLLTPLRVHAFYTNMSASVVMGQADFTGGSSNQGGSPTAKTLRFPSEGIMVGSKLVVADQGNNRVLIYNSLPSSNNVSADVVIGQADFNSNSANQGGSVGANTLSVPIGLSTDGTKLFIADHNNHRVLIFNQLPTSNNASADVVIGQNAMNTNTPGTTASIFRQPSSVFYDSASGKLFVSEELNNRTVIFNSVPTSNGASADVVMGQADFTSRVDNAGGTTSFGLSGAYGVRVVNGKVVIADMDNNRVLIWNSIPTTNGKAADVVVGHPNFTSFLPETVSPSSLDGMFVYPAINNNRLFIPDSNNNRVLIYNNLPASNGASADVVLGQTNFTSNSENKGGPVSSTSLRNPTAVYITDNKLLVTDNNNHRILIFDDVFSNPKMSINSPTLQAQNQIRISGSVTLDQSSVNSLQKVTASVNGETESNVTSLSGARDNGSNSSIYDFYNDFLPTVNGGDAGNYTIRFKAQSFSGEQDQVFYFGPFSLDLVTNNELPTITFTVNQTFRNIMSSNITKYQVWVDGELYIDNIATAEENNGKITVTGTTKLDASVHTFQIKAVNTSGHNQNSNTFTVDMSGGTVVLQSIPSPTPTAAPMSTPEITPEPTPSIPETQVSLPTQAPSVNPIETAVAVLGAKSEVISNVVTVATPLVVVGAMPLLAFASFTTNLFDTEISVKLFVRFLQAVGIIPKGKPQGVIFEVNSNSPVPFAIASVKYADSERVMETLVSDSSGAYSSANLAPGQYKIEVRHHLFKFPTSKPRPVTLGYRDFYKGEAFTIRGIKSSDWYFQIPMDSIENQAYKNTALIRRQRLIAYFNSISSFLFYPFLFLSAFLFVSHMTVLNTVIFGVYILIFLTKIRQVIQHAN